MGNKNKTISFRVNEDAFEALQAIAEERDISLSAVFRDYVDQLVEHDGQVEVVPEADLEARTDEGEDVSFPPTVEVPKRFVREHERLELEAEHLREQLEEYKAYVNDLQDRLEDEEEEILLLDELDDEDESYQLR
ncbi:CopG domain protein DNA-binding domain protein [Natrinema pellirubrum DSM 15624]|uniref:CopG domain protein DNA-binding domain protein n=2 Tax=Natrinema TaxID=88723 RepID=L0JNR7_NATP1|nr:MULTISPECIES: ribbon-helix-helix protein, CopG family [Natrinema]ELZ11209.1 CopG domain protein DNA-binding domain protein [Natrinema thermotolerans DSM 11552]AGB33180.1 Ribbon-helix-helix protein, copG family [Natrinema pellirubrum DSM 15624]ELY71845.1 CopG domain protein DNA-binding domain protein [Natrinema pellirubrum DSM 15624]QCC58421.1 ribbon-helix-helix protein, CopG family [Natrinema thermotolerans]WMT09550.1 ribbon-helix-helix protein, CopG family [Natrinema thermotolerans]